MNYKEKKFKDLTKEEKTLIDKKFEINTLIVECDDLLIDKFFDIESDELLDLKIDVLSKIANGKRKEVKSEDYYKILELYPKDKKVLWDWLSTLKDVFFIYKKG